MKKSGWLIALLALPVALAAVTPAGDQNKSAAPTNSTSAGEKSGNAFKEWELGAPLDKYPGLVFARPTVNSHVMQYENLCDFYRPPQDVRIGDFVVPHENVYLIFFQKKLVRIRIVNAFTSREGRDLAYFSALLGVLSQKHGTVKSVEDIYTRYDGRYQWKTDKLRIELTFALLEYADVELEQALVASAKKGNRIKTGDL